MQNMCSIYADVFPRWRQPVPYMCTCIYVCAPNTRTRSWTFCCFFSPLFFPSFIVDASESRTSHKMFYFIIRGEPARENQKRPAVMRPERIVTWPPFASQHGIGDKRPFQGNYYSPNKLLRPARRSRMLSITD